MKQLTHQCYHRSASKGPCSRTNLGVLEPQPSKMIPIIIFAHFCLLSISTACEFEPSSSYENTGIVCRMTRPAALVLSPQHDCPVLNILNTQSIQHGWNTVLSSIRTELARKGVDGAAFWFGNGTEQHLGPDYELDVNEQTTQVIQAAFRHATYPDINGERSVAVLGRVSYGLNNIQINDLSIENSTVDLQDDDAIDLMIQNVTATFKGTLHYAYSNWFANIGYSIDFEIESAIDLQINTRLTCENNRIAADTADCYLTFHKLILHLQGDKEPTWIKHLFTKFISLTLQLVLKGQVCKEINYVANLLADFIQGRAENFLNDGDIGVDISVAAFPVLKSNYVETHHKGLLLYHNHTMAFNESIYRSSLLTENRMLYFWFSEQVLNSIALATFLDKRLVFNITGEEIQEMVETEDIETHRAILKEIFRGAPLKDCLAKSWSASPPKITFTPEGTIVKAHVASKFSVTSDEGVSTVVFYFETDVTATIQASYAEKKLILHLSDAVIDIKDYRTTSNISAKEGAIRHFLTRTVAAVGIPAVISRLEPVLTSLMNSKGLHFFDIRNPEVITKDGYLIIQLDFGFPHHLLVDFLKQAM